MEEHQSNLPTVKLVDYRLQPYIKITFGKNLEREAAELAIEKWSEIMTNNPDQSFPMVWDCSEMREYNTGARSVWQKAMNQFHSQIEIIYLITDNRIIKLGASLMTAFSKHRIKTIRSLSEVFPNQSIQTDLII